MRARYKDRPENSTNGVGMITPLQCVTVDRLRAFFYWTRFLTTVYRSTIPLRFIWSIWS